MSRMAVKLPGNRPKHEFIRGLGEMSFETAGSVRYVLRELLGASEDCYCFYMLWDLKPL